MTADGWDQLIELTDIECGAGIVARCTHCNSVDTFITDPASVSAMCRFAVKHLEGCFGWRAQHFIEVITPPSSGRL